MGRLSISQKEPELLNKVLALMECNAELYFSNRREYVNKKDKKIVSGEVYFFHITDNELYNDLVNIGLTPDKSLTMKFPDIPNEYVRHFIRGCWDGDGSVYIEKKSDKLFASYTCGSLPFIDTMIYELVKIGIPPRTNHERKGKSISYYFKISAENHIKKLFHFLYDDVFPNQYLQRKYDIFTLKYLFLSFCRSVYCRIDSHCNAMGGRATRTI